MSEHLPRPVVAGDRSTTLRCELGRLQASTPEGKEGQGQGKGGSVEARRKGEGSPKPGVFPFLEFPSSSLELVLDHISAPSLR